MKALVGPVAMVTTAFAAVSLPGALAVAGSPGAVPALSSSRVARPAAPVPPVNPRGMRGIGSADTVLEVVAHDRRSTHADVYRFRNTPGGYVQIGEAHAARVGFNGLSMPDKRYAGDGTTPMGAYRFVYAFGSRPNPGVTRFRWRKLTPGSCWSGSRRHYNRWVRRRPCWSSDEDLWSNEAVAYRYAAVIDFNYKHPTYGRGSGIFLHERLPRATHGCVSLNQKFLIRTLRWLRPTTRIVIGTRRYLRALR